MEKVTAAIRFKQLDSSLASDIEILANYNKSKKEAMHHAISMALSVGGRELGEHESDLLLEIPLASSSIIRDIHSRIEHDLEFSSTIGVGDDIKDAKLALDWAVENRPSTIKVFEPAIAEKKLTSDDEDKFDYFQPEEVAIDETGKPVQIKKSELKVDNWADDSERITDDMKMKIQSIIKDLQQNKAYLDQLKETSPDVYNGVVALVQSISSMAQAAKEEDAKKQSNTIKKLVRFLDRSEQETLDKESADVLHLLIDAQESVKQAKEDRFRQKFNAHRQKRHERHKRTRDYSKETGLDHDFLMKLSSQIRKS